MTDIITINEVIQLVEVEEKKIEVVTVGTQGPPGTGGGGSTPHTAQATVDFGHASGGEADLASITVAAAWVTGSSVIVCTAAGVATPDHDAEDAALEGISAVAANLNEGVGFDVIARAREGSWGRFNINIMGV
jgi:hypothetical protein